MALTGQDLMKARNVRVAAGYPDSVGLVLFVLDGPQWFAAYGRRTGGVPTDPPSVFTVSPVGQGATDQAALNALLAAMVSSTAATATAEAVESTSAAAIATAVAAAAG